MQLPAEIWIALTSFAVVIIGAATKLASSTADRKVKNAKTADEQALKDREAARAREMEESRQTTIRLESELEKVKADAEKNASTHETLTNLVSATMRLIQVHSDEQHATREVMTLQAQSIGDVGQSLDRAATVINDNTIVTRETGRKADNIVRTVDEFKTQLADVGTRVEDVRLIAQQAKDEHKIIFKHGEDTVRLLDRVLAILEKNPLPPTNIVTVNTGTAAEKPADAGGLEAVA